MLVEIRATYGTHEARARLVDESVYSSDAERYMRHEDGIFSSEDEDDSDQEETHREETRGTAGNLGSTVP